MGGRNSQKKNVVVLLDYDDTHSFSWSSAVRSDHVGVSDAPTEFVRHPQKKKTSLDQHLDALFEKKPSTRENALASMIEAFNVNVQHKFVEKKSATLLYQCLNCIKRGSAKEVAMAAHLVGLLALTTGPGSQAQEILRESVSLISEALKSPSDLAKMSSLLECLAIITFVGAEDQPELTQKSMQLVWEVAAAKPSQPPLIATAVSAWSFLLTTMDGWRLDPKSWQGSIAFFSTLLDNRPVRIAAGEAIALIFEIGSLGKFCESSSENSNNEADKSPELMHIQGLRSSILTQVKNLCDEAVDLNGQRNSFQDILEFLEEGYSPETTVKVGRQSMSTTSWAQLIQVKFLRRFLGGGFVKHMQENEFLHHVFDFTPKKKSLAGQLSATEKETKQVNDLFDFIPKKSLLTVAAVQSRCPAIEKRLNKSPNSGLNKARTKLLNKERATALDNNTGHFAV
ncbi:OLC1v1010886C1 [Oldenlandia corymbosa var. corymbosa]|uniref:OLC1v1010886C1 n=1 Tax=Oldenlandia corymbosa var. corymbosa TaxID=529605 RepID=A0AAV1DSJ2_OLDCO|nr:OLC1v1010886C1 [Oldenlandia corymbosa var. corymbosa]